MCLALLYLLYTVAYAAVQQVCLTQITDTLWAITSQPSSCATPDTDSSGTKTLLIIHLS